MSLKIIDKGVFRSEGPTPASGEYALHYCFDNAGKSCDVEQATCVNIQEIDGKGKIIKETFAQFQR